MTIEDNMISLFTTITLALGIQYPNLLSSICWVESNHKPEAINIFDNGSPSFGICQVKLATAKWLQKRHKLNDITDKDLMTPEINILYAGLYLTYQLNRYNNIEQAISAYNAGSHIMSNADYVAKVLKRMEYYDEK